LLHFKIQCKKEAGSKPCEDDIRLDWKDNNEDWKKPSGAEAKPVADSEHVTLEFPSKSTTVAGKNCNGNLDDLKTDAKGADQKFQLRWKADFPKGNDVTGTIPVELKTTKCKKKSAWTVTIEFQGETHSQTGTAKATIKEDKKEEEKMEKDE